MPALNVGRILLQYTFANICKKYLIENLSLNVRLMMNIWPEMSFWNSIFIDGEDPEYNLDVFKNRFVLNWSGKTDASIYLIYNYCSASSVSPFSGTKPPWPVLSRIRWLGRSRTTAGFPSACIRNVHVSTPTM